MATLAPTRQSIFRGSHRFYLISALVMAGINIVAFAFANAMGRSSFGAPLIVHAHAVVFFGWVTIYVAQNVLASSGQLHLHRKLGWIAAGWMVAMVLLGTIVTVRLVRAGHAPFFFQPGYFLIMNPVGVLTFAGLSTWAIVLRRRTEWHKRLHFCGMAMLMGPSLGRLLPAPFLIPYVGPSLFAVMLLFPFAGVVADLRRTGRVHPAWACGITVMVAAQLLIQVAPSTPIGLAIYSAATAGSPGAAVLPLAFPPFPRL